SEIRSARPAKRYFAMHHAAATPNTRLQGTEIAATSSVSLIAAIASGSLNVARAGPRPMLRACTKTAASGAMRKIAMTTTLSTISVTRTGLVSVTGEIAARRSIAVSGIAEPPVAPNLREVDQKKNDERHGEHHRSNCRGGGV